MKSALNSDPDAGRRARTAALAAVIVVGLGAVAALSRTNELSRPTARQQLEDESLYVSPVVLKRISLGFNGIVADWYWMRTLQYVGRKIVAQDDKAELDDLAALDLKVLPALLDTSITLDPHFMAPYEYGAVVLPAAGNSESAIEFLKRGISSNPEAWLLCHHLGYMYWRKGDYQNSSDTYAAGARIAGAPAWMQAMSARVLAEGGSRQTAREIYRRMYDQADDPKVKQMALRRLMQVDAFDELDLIRAAIAEFRKRTNRCPAAWREITPFLRVLKLRLDEAGQPLDPAGTAYVLTSGGCDAWVDWRSEVPFK